MSVGVGWKISETGAQGAYGGRRCSDSRTGGLFALHDAFQAEFERAEAISGFVPSEVKQPSAVT